MMQDRWITQFDITFELNKTELEGNNLGYEEITTCYDD